MSLSALVAGISLPAVIFGLVVPVAVFFGILLLFKLVGLFIRFLRQKSLERAYRKAGEEPGNRKK